MHLHTLNPPFRVVLQPLNRFLDTARVGNAQFYGLLPDLLPVLLSYGGQEFDNVTLSYYPVMFYSCSTCRVALGANPCSSRVMQANDAPAAASFRWRVLEEHSFQMGPGQVCWSVVLDI